MDNLSLSDIASVTGNKDGFLEGNGIIILILHKSALLPTIRNLLPSRRYSSLEVET